ncbi:MAG TPA: acylneuraminate cytidylyltransferase family protein [Candidatus Paceibacterota bacterium]|jgi:N-acylneuraminate cytidylyltransferase
MKTSNEVWAIIPTRGGSIGLPEKNIRIIAGKPLLHYVLRTALHSRLLNRVVLTTDSDEIAQTAGKTGGIEVRRHNPSLSAPGQPTFGTFRNTLESLIRESESQPQAIVMLRVTTPLCLSSDIDSAVRLLLESKGVATSVLSVTKSDIHPKRVYVADEHGILKAREETPEQEYPLPRQTFDDVYIRNGAIYARFPEIVLGGSLWGDTPLAYVMPKERSTNINDEVDFVLAETLLKR